MCSKFNYTSRENYERKTKEGRPISLKYFDVTIISRRKKCLKN